MFVLDAFSESNILMTDRDLFCEALKQVNPTNAALFLKSKYKKKCA